MSDSIVSRARRIDSGEPLFLWDPPEHNAGVGYAVTTATCSNPLCPCTRMELTIRRVQKLSNASGEIHGPALGGEVSSDGTDVKINDDPTGAFTSATANWIRDRLHEEDHRGWLHERWRRARGQIGDPAYPPGVPPEGVDGMVFFNEVFPYDFDLVVVHEGHVYLAEDQYCLEPACTCDEFVAQFIDIPKGGKPIGHAKASVRRLQAPDVTGPSLVRQLWRELLDQNGSRRLRDRFQRMRRVARERATPRSHSRDQKVGRNDQCPCGSGNKYKRCCGA